MCSQATLDIEDCENKVEGVGQQELVCLCVVTKKYCVVTGWTSMYM